MTKKLLSLAFLVTLTLAQTAWGEEERVNVTKQMRDPIVDARLGVGFMFNPNLVGVNTSIEARLSRFFSLGPMLHAGFDQDQQLFIPTLSARFILPASVIKEKVLGWPNLELSVHTGFGAMYRQVLGFEFWNFAYQAGMNADFYVIDSLTLGLGLSGMVTSASVERALGMIYGSFAFHF